MALLIDADATTEADDHVPAQGGSRLTLWLVGLSLLALVMPLFLVANTLQEDSAALITERADLEAILGVTPTVDPTITVLDSDLEALRAQVDEIQPLARSLLEQHPDWLGISATLGSYDPAHIEMITIEQAGMVLNITGRASSEQTAIAYLHQLQNSGTFVRVTVQSITLTDGPRSSEAPERITEFVLRIELRGGQDG